ncbi:1,4-alpha-D-glucan glucanohydrolase [Schizosaccharomyces pombe]
MFGVYFVLLFLSSALIHVANAGSNAEWRKRIIYQILTDRFAVDDGSTDNPCDPDANQYCGGTWKGIENKLDYIEDMGFNAIWISPIDKNIEGDIDGAGYAYHGYWNTDYESLNEHFGTEDDLVSLITAAHKAGIWIMLDSIVNSMALAPPLADADYSSLNPFNKESYFHPYCLIDWDITDNETNVMDCWQDSGVLLADLDVESSDVSSYLSDHFKSLISKYDFDGLRIDAVKMMNYTFFPDFVDATGVYSVGEVFSYDPDTMCSYMSVLPGVTNYFLQLYINFSFTATGAGFTLIPTYQEVMASNCSKYDSTLMLTFIENHDLYRFPYYTSDQSQIMGALSFVLIWDGIPSIFYGQEQGFNGGEDPANRPALWLTDYDQSNPYYTVIKTMVAFRKFVITQDPDWVTSTYQSIESAVDHYVGQKNDVLVMFNNMGVTNNLTIYEVETNYTANEVVSDVFGHRTLTVGADKTLTASMTNGYPLIMYPHSKMSGFTLPTVNRTVMPSTSATATTTVYTSYYSPSYSARSFTGTGSIFTISSSSRLILSFKTLVFGLGVTAMLFVLFF